MQCRGRIYSTGLRVRQMQLQLKRVGLIDDDLLAELAYALGRLLCEDVAASGELALAQVFARARDLHALSRSSMRLQFRHF